MTTKPAVRGKNASAITLKDGCNMDNVLVAYYPPEWLIPGGPHAGLVDQLRDMVNRTNAGEQVGIVLPAIFDDNGNRLLEVTRFGAGPDFCGNTR